MENERAEMVDVLGQIRGYLDQLTEGCGGIGEQFQNGQTDQGQALLAEFLEGISWVSEAFAVTGSVQREHGVEVDLQELSDALGPAIDALENKDYGLIGEVLQYEVKPVLRTWSRELRKIPEVPVS